MKIHYRKDILISNRITAREDVKVVAMKTLILNGLLSKKKWKKLKEDPIGLWADLKRRTFKPLNGKGRYTLHETHFGVVLKPIN